MPETQFVRGSLEELRKPELPYCSDHQGDFLYRVAREQKAMNSLEIGFATGSTAAYMLAGTNDFGGRLLSIDYLQRDFDYLGVALVQHLGFSERHELAEGNSNRLLPMLLEKGEHYDLVFLDGWKTFDHLMIDVYFCNEMLRKGGIMVFDDSPMPAVSKINKFLTTHYEYRELDYSKYGQDSRLRIWMVLSQSGVMTRPYRAFRKTEATESLPVKQNWNFFRKF